MASKLSPAMIDMIKHYATEGNAGSNYGRGTTQTALIERGLLTERRALTADGWREADRLIVKMPADEVTPDDVARGKAALAVIERAGLKSGSPFGQVNLAESTNRAASLVAGSYGVSASPMSNHKRLATYLAQTARKSLTPKQRRRLAKAGHERRVTA